MMNPAQCRAARALIEMDQAGLAAAAVVSRNTIVAFEKNQRTPNHNNLKAIQQALEDAGVLFLPADEAGPGVRLKNGRDDEASGPGEADTDG